MEYPSLDKPIAGAFRFNTDSDQMEIYDGNQWTVVLSTSSYQQTGGTKYDVAENVDTPTISGAPSSFSFDKFLTLICDIIITLREHLNNFLENYYRSD